MFHVQKSHLDESLSKSRIDTEAGLDRVRAGIANFPMASPLSSTIANLESLGRSQQNLAHHDEQLKHFQGGVYSIVRLIGTRIARQPYRMARLHNSGQRPKGLIRPKKSTLPPSLKSEAKNLETIENHPILDLLKQPNSIMTSWTLKFHTVASLELTGKAYWWIDTDESGKVTLWPLPASWVEAKHDPKSGELYAKWRVSPPGYGTPYEVDGRDIVYFYYPDPRNPMSALSPLQAMAKTVTADEEIEETQRRAFMNRLNFGMAIIVGKMPGDDSAGLQLDNPPVLTIEQRKQLKNVLKSEYRGVVNSEEPLILDGLIKDVKRINSTNAEMDFLNSSKATQARLAKGWGVNPIVLGEIEGATRASSYVAEQLFVDNVIQPRLEMMSETMTTFLVKRLGEDNLLLYFEEAKATDIDYELMLEEGMMDRGAMSRNEWRSRHDLPKIMNGDNAYVGGVLAPVTAITASSAGQPRITSFANEIGEKRIVDLWLRQHESAERELQQTVAAWLAELGEKLRPVIDQLISGSDVTSGTVIQMAYQVSSWHADFVKRLTPVVYGIAMRGAIFEYEMHFPRRAADFDEKGLFNFISRIPKIIADRVGTYVDDLMGREHWQGILHSVGDAMQNAVEVGKELAIAGRNLAEYVMDTVFGVAEIAARALGVATTETTGAMNGGQQVAREELAKVQIVVKKKWVDKHDERVRATHRQASIDNQEVNPLDYFIVGGYRCKYPADPDLPAKERCNCRCIAISVTKAG